MFYLWLVGAVYALGVVTAISALFRVRTSQGTVAWVISLVTMPALAVPLFWMLGRRRFEGYVLARRLHLREMAPEAGVVAARYSEQGLIDAPKGLEDRVLVHLARLPFTVGNDATLLVDGDETFRSILEGIDRAKDYVLVQFYIFRDDRLGSSVSERLIARAKAGVRVFVLYDEVGSPEPSRARLAAFAAAGVVLLPFNTRRGKANRFQINFRNHRKLVIVDGREAWAGGINVGEEYLGRDPRLGQWRDTHVHVVGPAASTMQLPFLEDWHWASGQTLPLNWEAEAVARPGRRILCVPTGPADEEETCSLLFTDLIGHAQERLWIATPYFVPDDAVMSALTLAAMRGVDVRILLPDYADHRIIWLARFAYVEACERAGIKLLIYARGFLHEKVMLIDDRLATVGTANLDNRSLRLNFELTLLFDDADFARRTAAMLERDFEDARPLTHADVIARGRIFGLGVRIANLFAPVL